MAVHIFELLQSLSANLVEDRKNWHKMLTDITVLETLIDILKPLSYLTDALSGKKHCDSFSCEPILKHIQLLCSKRNSQLAAEVEVVIRQDLEGCSTGPEVVNILTIKLCFFKASLTVEKAVSC